MPQSTYQMINVWHKLNDQCLLQLVFPESLGEMTSEDPKETELPACDWLRRPGPGSRAPPLARGGPRLPGSGRQSRTLAGGELSARGWGQPAALSSCAARWEPEPESEPEPPAGASSRKPRAWSSSRAGAEHARYGAALRSKRVVDCVSKKDDVNKSLSRRGEEAYSHSGAYGKNFLQRSLSKSRQIFLKKKPLFYKRTEDRLMEMLEMTRSSHSSSAFSPGQGTTRPL
ncbi:uncharacterized protein LOC144371240 [Ictidomys tridecemlineatus]